MLVEKTKNVVNVGTDLSSLKAIADYSGTKDCTVMVFQDEAIILKSGRGVDGLYTFGACPCAILVAVSKDLFGNVKKVCMAHVDGLILPDQIEKSLRIVKLGAPILEVYIIGGNKVTSANVLEGCEGLGAQIKFFCANLDCSRVDAAAVDAEGVVYYGKRDDLTALSLTEETKQKIKMLFKQVRRDSVQLSTESI